MALIRDILGFHLSPDIEGQWWVVWNEHGKPPKIASYESVCLWQSLLEEIAASARRRSFYKVPGGTGEVPPDRPGAG